MNEKDNDELQALHERWLDRLDAVGAAADRGELWELWAAAPVPKSDEARHLWQHLVNQPTRSKAT